MSCFGNCDAERENNQVMYEAWNSRFTVFKGAELKDDRKDSIERSVCKRSLKKIEAMQPTMFSPEKWQHIKTSDTLNYQGVDRSNFHHKRVHTVTRSEFIPLPRHQPPSYPQMIPQNYQSQHLLPPSVGIYQARSNLRAVQHDQKRINMQVPQQLILNGQTHHHQRIQSVIPLQSSPNIMLSPPLPQHDHPSAVVLNGSSHSNNSISFQPSFPSLKSPSSTSLKQNDHEYGSTQFGSTCPAEITGNVQPVIGKLSHAKSIVSEGEPQGTQEQSFVIERAADKDGGLYMLI